MNEADEDRDERRLMDRRFGDGRLCDMPVKEEKRRSERRQRERRSGKDRRSGEGEGK